MKKKHMRKEIKRLRREVERLQEQVGLYRQDAMDAKARIRLMNTRAQQEYNNWRNQQMADELSSNRFGFVTPHSSNPREIRDL